MSKISNDALKLLKEKQYFKGNENSWEDLCNRVSTAIADAEETEEMKQKIQKEIYDSMVSLDFIFSTPCLLNADKNNRGQLSSCFVADTRDNIEDICRTDAEFTKIFQRNGGVGTDLSVLRPAKEVVETSKGYAGGVITFMHKYDSTADDMTKFNPSRKGAIKINLKDNHPQIFDFIHCKDNLDILNRMNISVSFYDEFMLAVENDLDWNLEFPDYSFNKEIYNTEWDGNLNQWKSKGYPTKIYKTIKARELLKEFSESSWKTGEPGANYQSRMDIDNMNPHLSLEIYTNPCNEFTNIPYSSCNLGSINLLNCVQNGKLNLVKLADLTAKSVRWLDNMITVNVLPLKKIDEVTKAIRPIGLGIMGLADAFYALGVKYNSEEGYKIAEDIIKTMKETAIKTSVQLANERGKYPAWKGSKWEEKNIEIRNSNLLSIAPTGSISFMAGVSGGSEPNFALTYSRRTYDGNTYYVNNIIFEKKLKELGIYSNELMDKIEKNHGSCQGISEIPKNIQDIFVTAHDLTPEEHVDMIAILQQHVDLSLSKCVAKGTLVQTNKGILPIEELGNASGNDVFDSPIFNLKVRDMNGEWKKVTNHYSGGLKDTKIIKFNNGNTLECSNNHMLFTINGWKKASEITKGEQIVCRSADFNEDNNGGLQIVNEFIDYKTNANKINIPNKMSEDLATWLGMIVSDGHLTEATGNVGITCANDDVENKFIKLSTNLFHLTVQDIKITYDKRTKTTRKIFITSRNLCRWAKNIIGENCTNKQIPKQIMLGSKNEKIAFINGVTLDGYISSNKLIIYEGYSKKLAEQLFAVCCSLNLKPYFGTKPVKNGRLSTISYSVRMGENIFTPIEKHKNVKLSSTTTIPVPDYVKNMKLDTKHCLYNQLRTIRRGNYEIMKTNNAILDGYDVDFTKYIITITEIIDNINEVYDIEVEDTHSYLINNIISHNTVNFSNKAIVEDIYNIYIYAWKKGLKGLSVYRDGCRENQTLSTGKKEEIKNIKQVEFDSIQPIEKEELGETYGSNVKERVACGNLYLGLFRDNKGNLSEMFINTSKGGICQSNINAISRLVSLALRSGIKVETICDQLMGIKCPACTILRSQGKDVGISCPDTVGQYILEKYKQGSTMIVEKVQRKKKPTKNEKMKCPNCGEQMRMEAGCVVCNCGFSRCG